MAKFLIPGAKSISPVKQPTNMTCWLACFQMALQWKGQDDSQDKILAKLASNGVDGEKAIKEGLLGKDFKTAALALGFWANYPGGDMSMDVLKRMYLNPSSNGGPVWCAGLWKKDVRHVRLIVGWEDGAEGLNPGVFMIDPWYPPDPNITFEGIQTFADGHNVYNTVPAAIQVTTK